MSTIEYLIYIAFQRLLSYIWAPAPAAAPHAKQQRLLSYAFKSPLIVDEHFYNINSYHIQELA